MIAERIKHLREKNNLTQSSLAKKLNVTRSSVNAWEMGISVPSTALIVDLAKLFHVSTDYLLDISANKTINLDKYSDNEQELVFRMLQYFDETGTQIHNNSKS